MIYLFFPIKNVKQLGKFLMIKDADVNKHTDNNDMDVSSDWDLIPIHRMLSYTTKQCQSYSSC